MLKYTCIYDGVIVCLFGKFFSSLTDVFPAKQIALQLLRYLLYRNDFPDMADKLKALLFLAFRSSLDKLKALQKKCAKEMPYTIIKNLFVI